MQNIYTVGGELLTDHIDEEFEISELVETPTMIVSVLGATAGFGGTVSQEQGQEIMMKYKFSQLLPSININLSIIGYVYNGEFFLYSVMLRDEQKEMSPSRRCHFIEFFNSNADGVKMRHVPVSPTVMRLDGAKKALENDNKFEDVLKYTVKGITELATGPSKMNGLPRKGLVFKSTTTDFSFKVLSKEYMEGME